MNKIGEVKATGELPLPQKVIDSAFFLMKKGLLYLDAFPVVEDSKNSIFFFFFFFP